MAKKPTTTKAADPFDALAVGLAADHKAAKLADPAQTDAASAIVENEPAPETAAPAAEPAQVEPTAEAAPEPAQGEAVHLSGKRAFSAIVDDPAEVPPAPGDDAETVFQRRLERLNTAVEFAQFDSGTAFGDLRDVILDLFKLRPKLWSAMIPSEQNDLSRHVEGVAKGIIRKVVLVIAQEESLTIEGTLLSKFAVNGESVEAKVKIDNVDRDVLNNIFMMSSHKVVIVSADDKRFQSMRRELPAADDQLGMEFASDMPVEKVTRPPEPAPKPEKTHPADDSDLAGEDEPDADDDQGEEGDDEGAAHEPDAEPDTVDDGSSSFAVFDTRAGLWLVAEQGDEGEWNTDKAKAGTWTYFNAKQIAEDFDGDSGGEVVVRQLGDFDKPKDQTPEMTDF